MLSFTLLQSFTVGSCGSVLGGKAEFTVKA